MEGYNLRKEIVDRIDQVESGYLDLSYLNEKITDKDLPEIIKCLKSKDLSDVVRSINLSENEIKFETVKPSIFGELDNLKVLTLSDNNILEITEGDFVGLEKLESISLSNNEIKKITKNSFKELIGIESINIMGNPIDSLEIGSFDNLRSLKLIYHDIEELEDNAQSIYLSEIDKISFKDNLFLNDIERKDVMMSDSAVKINQNFNDTLKAILGYNPDEIGREFYCITGNGNFLLDGEHFLVSGDGDYIRTDENSRLMVVSNDNNNGYFLIDDHDQLVEQVGIGATGCNSVEKIKDAQTGIEYIDVRKSGTSSRDFLIIDYSTLNDRESLFKFIQDFKEISVHGCNVFLQYQDNGINKNFVDINLCELGFLEKQDNSVVLGTISKLNNESFKCYRVGDVNRSDFINEDCKDRFLVKRDLNRNDTFVVLNKNAEHIVVLKSLSTELSKIDNNKDIADSNILKQEIKKNLVYLLHNTADSDKEDFKNQIREYFESSIDSPTPEFKLVLEQLESIKEGDKPEKPSISSIFSQQPRTRIIPSGVSSFTKEIRAGSSLGE